MFQDPLPPNPDVPAYSPSDLGISCDGNHAPLHDLDRSDRAASIGGRSLPNRRCGLSQAPTDFADFTGALT